MLEFSELWEKLLAGDESVELEVKRAQEIGKSVMETASAFSNEPNRGGGYLLLGVAEKEDALFSDYEVVGVPDAGKLQADLASLCRDQMTPPIRPEIAVAQVAGKTVVVVFVPEVEAHDKPVFITSKGPQAGSFRRIGNTDQRCTDDDLAMFYHARGSKSFDETVIKDADLSDLDPNAIAEYRRLRREINPSATELTLNDTDLLYSLGAVARQDGGYALTVAGMLLFGSAQAQRRVFPLARVDYIRVEGREWVQDPDHRFQTIEYRGPLLLTIPRVIAQVFEDIPKAFSLPEGDVHRKDVPTVPLKVIREAVVNQLMHRSYRTRQPAQIIRYSNRIELRNPGVSLVPDERLGEPGSRTRNEKIAAVLHEANLAETKGSGIRVMREMMRRANLTAPLFESDRQRDTFTVTVLVHHLFGPADVAWLGQFRDCDLSDEDARALMFLREVEALNNAAYRDINSVDTLTASRRLQRLCKLNLIAKKGQGMATYYVQGDRFQRAASPSQVKLRQEVEAQSSGLNPLDNAQSRGLDPLDKPSVSRNDLIASLPAPLAEQVRELRARGDADTTRAAILALCRLRPMTGRDLASFVRRDPTYLKYKFLGPMIRDGSLRYLYPDSRAHPRQAYTVPSPADKPDVGPAAEQE